MINAISYDRAPIRASAVRKTVRQAWAAVLTALSDLNGMRSGALLSFWGMITRAAKQFHTSKDTTAGISIIRARIGIDMWLRPIQDKIRTQSGLTRFICGTIRNTFVAALSYIRTLILQLDLLEAEDLREVAR